MSVVNQCLHFVLCLSPPQQNLPNLVIDLLEYLRPTGSSRATVHVRDMTTRFMLMIYPIYITPSATPFKVSTADVYRIKRYSICCEQIC